MSDVHPDGQIQAFFDSFATASNALDIDRLAELFDETSSPPTPPAPDPSPAGVPAGLPRRAELFAAAGITRVILGGLRHQALDDTYVLARTEWRAERAGASAPVRLSSTFILRREADRLQVVCYLNHQELARTRTAA